MPQIDYSWRAEDDRWFEKLLISCSIVGLVAESLPSLEYSSGVSVHYLLVVSSDTYKGRVRTYAGRPIWTAQELRRRRRVVDDQTA